VYEAYTATLYNVSYTATHCNTLQHTPTHYNALQQSTTHSVCCKVECCSARGIHCNTLQLLVHCNILQHTATHYNTLQHSTTHQVCCKVLQCTRRTSITASCFFVSRCVAVCCSVLQVLCKAYVDYCQSLLCEQVFCSMLHSVLRCSVL